jgi:mannose-1-phosphate guanylyltransferase / mannose-6-phosphate isomerase
MIVVILAGGKGTRLWPLSNQGLPKQFLRIKDHRSLLQRTYLRFSEAEDVEEILVVTNENYKSLVEEHLREINVSCPIITEPCCRNTAPAICLALKYIQEKMRGSSLSKVFVSPSDHLISPERKFREDLSILEHISFDGNIITFGVRPTRPETGYGYIKTNTENDGVLYSVDSFIEKPTLEKAGEFFLYDEYFWNAGVFLFSIGDFWKEMKMHSSEIFDAFQKDYSSILEEFANLPNISIDYALMEKTKNIKVFPLDASWSDIGSWDSVYDVLEKDENFNVKMGKVYDIETKNSLIFADKKVVSTIGLEDIIVVETDEGIFIGKKGHSQKIKTIISQHSI